MKKERKFKWVLAVTSLLLMISMGFTNYVHHFEIILSPFKWAILNISAYLLFFLLGVVVVLLNVSGEYKD